MMKMVVGSARALDTIRKVDYLMMHVVILRILLASVPVSTVRLHGHVLCNLGDGRLVIGPDVK